MEVETQILCKNGYEEQIISKKIHSSLVII